MKSKAILTMCLFALLACEEGFDTEIDAGIVSQIAESEPNCVRYVDPEAEPGGDGLSWETALTTVEDGIDVAVEAEEECQVWVKGDSELDMERHSDLLGQNEDVKVFDGFSGNEITPYSNKPSELLSFSKNRLISNHLSKSYSNQSHSDSIGMTDSVDLPSSNDDISPSTAFIDAVPTANGYCDCNAFDHNIYVDNNLSLRRTNNDPYIYTNVPGRSIKLRPGSGGAIRIIKPGTSSDDLWSVNSDGLMMAWDGWYWGGLMVWDSISVGNDLHVGNNILIDGFDAIRRDGNRFIWGPDGWHTNYFPENVWIGPNPNNKRPSRTLEVAGTIKAEEIIVETGWADFVFNDDYDLLGLEEVDKYIKENKHLPGIPSEAEVNEDGVSIGDSQTRLLTKIEELTL
ncbi:MAG: hypothetical protein GY847_04785, partial [Proteobacteria bacterium]|nr:hypothetical protein [Pseudomonadota bacterium]